LFQVEELATCEIGRCLTSGAPFGKDVAAMVGRVMSAFIKATK
jgi:hypothetical protein